MEIESQLIDSNIFFFNFIGTRRHILLHFHGRISRRQINSGREAGTLSGRGPCRK